MSHCRILSANVNGIRSKRDLIAALLHTSNIDCMAIQESKLCDTVQLTDISILGYRILRRDRTNNGGGVALFLKEDLCYVPVESKSPSLEIVGARVWRQGGCNSFTILSCYRPPGQSVSVAASFVDELSSFLATLDPKTTDSVILAGDFNWDLAHQESVPLVSTLEAFDLDILNDPSRPTHGKRVLDWVCGAGMSAGVAGPELWPPIEKRVQGHSVIHLSVPWNDDVGDRRESKKWVQDWKSCDWEKARFLVAFTEDPCRGWVPCSVEDRMRSQMGSRVEGLYGVFTTVTKKIIQSTVPSKIQKVGRKVREPWLSDHISRLIENERATFDQYSKHPDRSDLLKYAKQQKKIIKSAIRTAKRREVMDAIKEGADSRQMWKIYKRLAGKSRQGVPTLQTGSVIASLDSEKAALLVGQFSNNFQPVAPEPLHKAPSCVPVGAFLSTGRAEQLLKALKPKKATGLDEIPAKFLRSLRSEISSSVALLINASLVEQSVPVAWKRGWVVPIPKKASPTEPADFRPVTILDGVSKVWESHVLDLLLPFIETEKSQFGFNPGSSCGDAFMRLQLSILALAERPGAVKLSIVALDLSKAFDRIPSMAPTPWFPSWRGMAVPLPERNGCSPPGEEWLFPSRRGMVGPLPERNGCSPPGGEQPFPSGRTSAFDS